MESEKTIRVGAELDIQTDEKLGRWAKAERRSKRAHAAHLLQRLASLRDTNPAGLAMLGLTECAGTPA